MNILFYILTYLIVVTVISKRYHNKNVLNGLFYSRNDILKEDHLKLQKISDNLGIGNWHDIFTKGKPICAKCNKEVDYFGPWYDINRGCSRHIHAICHGEIEIREFSNDHPYCYTYFQGYPNAEQWERMGVSFFGKFFYENISIWRGIPHFHFWRYNNDGNHSRVCRICELRQVNHYIGNDRWEIGGDSYFRRKLGKVVGRSYVTK